jgi:hypothetical protein
MIDQQNDRIRKLSANISEKIVEHRIGVHFTWQEREDGSQGLTEDAQDLFNEIYDIVKEELIQEAN